MFPEITQPEAQNNSTLNHFFLKWAVTALRMNHFYRRAFSWVSVVAIFVLHIASPSDVFGDTRTNIQTVNSDRTFPRIESKAAWDNRARDIREQVLLSCGLWPMPEKTPLSANVFGKLERDGYSVEKVYFQSSPGFYVCGNLYRPLGKGAGPFPAILNPHGHWDNGRMADLPEGSIAARCINFAKQGMIAFSYDMVGYNDTFFPDHVLEGTNNTAFYKRHRRFATNEVNMLWNISLMGLQTWNSIRALDFLESLPDVDKTRLACTGESGGGTQTYTLGAIDDRLAAQAPVVMVSHTMQGGCSCENAPGLRIDHSNVEIAAVAAPRPQIIVGATGDWTRDTMKMEGPSIESVYRLFNATNKLRYVLFDFRHNYNQTSREAVYDFFGTWLKAPAPASHEVPYVKEPDSELRIFPNNKLPADALPEKEFITWMINRSKAQLDALKPTDKKSLAHFKEVLLPAWRHTLQLDTSKDNFTAETVYLRSGTNYISEKLYIGRSEKGDRLSAMHFAPATGGKKLTVILADTDGKAPFLTSSNEPTSIAMSFLKHGVSVLLLDTFLTGDLANAELSSLRNQQVEMFFTTYNRTDIQERVQDLVSAAAYVRKRLKNQAMIYGTGRAGLWALLAAPAVDGVIADCAKFDFASDTELLQPDVFVPGMRKIGGFENVAALAAPNPLLLHNFTPALSVGVIENAYAFGKTKPFKAEPTKLTDEEMSSWVSRLK